MLSAWERAFLLPQPVGKFCKLKIRIKYKDEKFDHIGA